MAGLATPWIRHCRSLYLSRDFMQKCSPHRRAESIRLSATFVYSVETNKHIFIVTVGT